MKTKHNLAYTSYLVSMVALLQCCYEKSHRIVVINETDEVFYYIIICDEEEKILGNAKFKCRDSLIVNNNQLITWVSNNRVEPNDSSVTYWNHLNERLLCSSSKEPYLYTVSNFSLCNEKWKDIIDNNDFKHRLIVDKRYLVGDSIARILIKD